MCLYLVGDFDEESEDNEDEQVVSDANRSDDNVHVSPSVSVSCLCLQCFDAVGWAAGRASGL